MRSTYHFYARSKKSFKQFCLVGASLLALMTASAHADDAAPMFAPITDQGTIYGVGQAQYNIDYSKAQIDIGGAYSAGLTGKGVVVAVFDSGISRQNVELTDSVAGYDALLGGAVTNDNEGHGTFVTGIIDAVGNHVEGVAYQATSFPVQVINAAGAMTATDGQLATGIAVAFNAGARIMNNSWNTSTPITSVTAASFTSYIPESLAMMKVAVGRGAVFVFAAGNDGNSQVGAFAGLPQLFPSLLPGWAAVVATDSTGAIASYSNRCGVAAAYCIAAPGSNIISTLGSGYGIGNGTSFAAPQVSGAIALLLQEFPYLSAGQALQIILASATKTGIYANQAIYGQGLLNVAAAVQPVGTITIPGSNTFSKRNVTIASSTAIGSQSFAQSWTASVGPIMVVDSFGRSYEAPSTTFATAPSHSFNTLSATRQYGFGEMAEYAPGIMGFTSDQYLAPSMQGVALTGASGSKLEITTGIDPAFGFGSFETGTMPAGALVTSDGIGNPFMNLADDPTTAHVSLPMHTILGEAKLNASAFTGYARTGDITSQMTDPSYVAPTVSGGALEIAAPISALDMKVAMNFGGVSESDRLLGGSTSGAFGTTQSTMTMFSGITAEAKLTDDLHLIGGFEMGQSNANQTQSVLNVRYGALSSTSFHMGVVEDRIFGDKDKMGFVVSQPLRVSGGDVGIDVPTARDFAGDVFSTHENLTAADNGHETDMQGFYAVSQGRASSFDVGMLVRLQPDNVRTAAPETIGLMRWTAKLN